MPRKPSAEKQCAKCRERQPLAAFQRGLPIEELVVRPRGSRFCAGCRTTMKPCGRCKQELPLTEFAREGGDKHGWCKRCYSEMRHAYYRRLAQYFAERAIAAGKDFADDRGYQHYSQDPDHVLLAAKRRRAQRLRLARRDGYARHEVFNRDGWKCWLCGVDLTEVTATIDHVIPIAAGGPDTRDNVRAACGACNSKRGARAADTLT